MPITFTETELEEIKDELGTSYRQFFDFSIKLLENLTERNNHLKFAVVNMQISLELFLKYYFVAIGEPERIFSLKNGKKRYKDSSDVISIFFSTERMAYIKKNHLDVICQKRNDIVHKGKVNEWDDELAEYIISCALFIQGTLKSQFDETIFTPAYSWSDNKLSKHSIWRNGAEKFAIHLSSTFNCQLLHCIHCDARAFINKEYFNYDEVGEGFQCLACFHDIDTEHDTNIIKCDFCGEDAYLVEILNPQPHQIHLGKCLSCEERIDVRQCSGCEEYYFFTNRDEFVIDDTYYCSENCYKLHT